jgi:peptidyl-prolyl cis-trans isomerase SurA
VAEKCLIEVGMFSIGKNPYVDKLAFKCGEYQPLENYSYTWVLGQKLKKGPTDYKDVYEELKEDCLKSKKEAEIEGFIQKNKVEIDEEVLKTVNRCRNK